MISKSSLNISVGVKTNDVLLLVSVDAEISTIFAAEVLRLNFSNVNVSVESLNTIISFTWISLFAGFLDWTKNLAKSSLTGTETVPLRVALLFENSLLISSIWRTLLVLHSI